MSELRDTQAPGRSRVVARARHGETAEQLEWRQRWGRFDELAVDFTADTAGEVPDNTHNTHRSGLNSLLLPVVGDLWLVDCDRDALRTVVRHAATRGDTRPRAALSVLGTIIGWAMADDVRRWPPGHPPFGGAEVLRAARRTDKRVRATADRGGGQIRYRDCPTIEQTWEYAEAVRAEAVHRWGPDAAHLGELPKTQYVTGTRIAETVALHSERYAPDTRTYLVDRQIARREPWEAHAPMPTGPTKNRYPRHAAVWDWAAEEFLDELVHDAATQRNGLLFAPPTRQHRAWLATLEELLRDVARSTGYPYTTQWHRHAYASLNLARTTEGGYDRSVPVVAEWLGDTIESVTKTYWHATNTTTSPWSRHRPGTRGPDR